MMNRDLASLDRALALERVGGDEELLREIAVLFLEECPQMMSEIQSAVATGNAIALERTAHSLKGSVGNFGAHQAFRAAARLEAIGRSRDLSSVSQAWADLAAAMEALCPALSELQAA
ncbi:MAG: Hpt domain-containing protein [Acidobacteria bacterium]|nr:Hpt domain-containing protein [Acidobacteriota bacterium]